MISLNVGLRRSFLAWKAAGDEWFHSAVDLLSIQNSSPRDSLRFHSFFLVLVSTSLITVEVLNTYYWHKGHHITPLLNPLRHPGHGIMLLKMCSSSDRMQKSSRYREKSSLLTNFEIVVQLKLICGLIWRGDRCFSSSFISLSSDVNFPTCSREIWHHRLLSRR